MPSRGPKCERPVRASQVPVNSTLRSMLPPVQRRVAPAFCLPHHSTVMSTTNKDMFFAPRVLALLTVPCSPGRRFLTLRTRGCANAANVLRTENLSSPFELLLYGSGRRRAGRRLVRHAALRGEKVPG